MDLESKLDFLQSVNLNDVKFQIKIADFGLSKQINKDDQEEEKGLCGTPLYMAPQMLMKQKYTTKFDIWSLGVIYCEILTGKPPFLATSVQGIKEKLEKGEFKLPVKEGVSNEAYIFIHQCLQYYEQDRPGIEELSLHPYLKIKTQAQYDNMLQRQYQSKNFSDLSTSKSTNIAESVDQTKKVQQVALVFNSKSKSVRGSQDVGQTFNHAFAYQERQRANSMQKKFRENQEAKQRKKEQKLMEMFGNQFKISMHKNYTEFIANIIPTYWLNN